MKQLVIGFILYLGIAGFSAQAQTNYLMPKGFSSFKNFEEKEIKIEQDFDGDGKKDLAIMSKKMNEEDNNYLLVFLNKEYTATKNVNKFMITETQSYNLEFKNNVLTIGGCFGNGRYCETYKFRYNAKLTTMQLIGYDEESFGNAVHDGAYKKSVNLLTNKIEISEHKYDVKKDQEIVLNKISKTVKIPMMTIKSMNLKAFDFLHDLGKQYFKNK